jgi:beta-glucuronidase
VKLDGEDASARSVSVSVPELEFKVTAKTDGNGFAPISGIANKTRYWSPEDPKLYEVKIETGDDTVVDRVGLRTIATDGDRLLLNGKETFLRGISIHEENPIRSGRAHSIEDARMLLSWAKELGCNFVRLAHYPHNENMVRLADEMGILVWEEIPVYWTISWENPETYQNAKSQLEAVITRDKNRASVIIWSMANETPVSEPRNRFLSGLAETARRMDPSRLVSAALEMSGSSDDPSVRAITDPFASKVDIISFNQYIGWYDGIPEKLSTIKWRLPKDKPIFISEFGAGAKSGFHGDRDTIWTEEHQQYLYEETLKSIGKIGNLRGISPWILVDFRSPRRHLPGIQDGWNRKGLLSEKGEKKKAFFVLQNFYRNYQEP